MCVCGGGEGGGRRGEREKGGVREGREGALGKIFCNKLQAL